MEKAGRENLEILTMLEKGLLQHIGVVQDYLGTNEEGTA
jgi:hypothetical protein